MRLIAGSLNPSESAEFTAWLKADQGNQSRLDRYRQLFSPLGSTLNQLVDSGQMPDYPLKPQKHTSSFPVFGRWVVGFGMAAALTLAAAWWYRLPKAYQTLAAQRQSLVLSDGTKVDLNAETSISVDFHGSDRRIRLHSGEAYFAVAQNPGRPFIVETAAGAVQVLGTTFDVQALKPSSLDVTLLEGSLAVKAADASGSQVLQPGDQFHVEGHKVSRDHLSELEAEQSVAWREGKMIFASEPLDVVIQRFARYHGVSIEVDPSLAAFQIGGRFKLDDLDTFLKDLEGSFPANVVRGSDGKISVVRR
jgi:transmembrane sensor